MLDDIVDRLKARISGASTSTLEEIAEGCMDEFRAACCRDDVPEAAATLIVQMAQIRYNQLGDEGLASQSYSGMSETYLDDWPASVRRGLERFRRLKTL